LLRVAAEEEHLLAAAAARVGIFTQQMWLSQQEIHTLLL